MRPGEHAGEKEEKEIPYARVLKKFRPAGLVDPGPAAHCLLQHPGHGMYDVGLPEDTMLRRLAASLLRKLGFELRRIDSTKRTLSPLEGFLETWAQISVPPKFIVDVGANHGKWTRTALQYFPEAGYLLIEPQDELKKYSEELLGSGNIRWITAGVGELAGEMQLSMMSRDDSANFRLTKKEADRLGIPQRAVPITTLDEIVRSEGRVPEMVKIDAEGLDLRVLQGATTLLGKTEVFLVESGVCCLELENSFHAIYSFLSSHGYRLFDFTDFNRAPKSHALWLTEMVFVRGDSPAWHHARLSSYE